MQNRVAYAVNLFDEMENNTTTCSYNAFIGVYCQRGDLEEVKNWYHQLVESKDKSDGETVTHSLRRAKTLQYTVDVLFRESNLEIAKDIVKHGRAGKYWYDLELPPAE